MNNKTNYEYLLSDLCSLKIDMDEKILNLLINFNNK